VIFFDGFAEQQVDVGDDVVLRVRSGGAGRRSCCCTAIRARTPGGPLTIWADWTTDLRGAGPIESGHHMAEDAPEELAAALTRLLAM
jgi:haloacetate dehalogenase